MFYLGEAGTKVQHQDDRMYKQDIERDKRSCCCAVSCLRHD